MSKDTERQAEIESRRIVDRVSAEAGSVDGSMNSRPTHDQDNETDDSIEYWGTRIGRLLGMVITVGLILYLLHFLFNDG